MNHKFIILGIWFPITLCIVILDLVLLTSLQSKKQQSLAIVSPIDNTLPIRQVLTSSEQVLGASIVAGDARELLVKKFLTKHQSPLAAYAHTIIDRADFYNIDYRLVPAIAMCESIGGKRMPSSDSHNAWGISVETGETSGASFQNWLHAIDWVSQYIRKQYMNLGLTDPISMGAKWAPPSVEKGNSWANCVYFFMEEIQI